MASPVSTGGGNHYIQIPVVVADPVCGESASASREKTLNRFVRLVAFGEWAGNAFGALAFLWATVVMLGGFCSSLNTEDFWFAAVMVFIEAFRVFSRNYTLDNQSLFGTTRALRWISLSFTRMLMRPQEGNEVVLIMGLCVKVVEKIPMGIFLRTALIMQMSKWHLRGAPQLTSDRRRIRELQLWVVLVAYLIVAVGNTSRDLYFMIKEGAVKAPCVALLIADTTAGILAQVVAVFLLNLRPRRIVHLTSRPCGCKLLSLAKVISAIWLAYNSALLLLPRTLPVFAISMFNTPFTIVVLSFGSLQTPATETKSIFGRWLHVTLHILFLWDLLITFNACPHCCEISFFLLAALLVGNLQIPAAVTQVVLSSLRLRRLRALHHLDHYQQPQEYSQNLVPSIAVFYMLALCEGALYIMACILGVFSYFPCRSLLLRSGFTGQWGSKAVNLYYRRVYTTRMEIGVLAAGSTMTLDTFAMQSLRSSSWEVRLIGVRVLDSLLQEDDYNKVLISRVTSSNKAMSTLISILGGTEVQDEGGIRLFAARVTAKIAGHVRLAEVPAGMVKSVSSLLGANNKLTLTTSGYGVGGNNVGNQPTYGTSAKERNGGLSWVCQCWQRMKDEWSVPDEPLLTQQDSFPVIGMLILKRLAHDPDNCVEIIKTRTLISKIIGLIRYTTDNHDAVICSSLHLVRRLVSTGGKIGATVRQELSESPFLVDNLADTCEDSRSSSEVWTPAMDIIAKLALDENARQEVGSKHVIICKLVNSFLGRDEPNNQSLRMAAGEALVNLTIESPANCSAILEEPRRQLIKDLKDILCEAEYRIYMCTAASLLQNLCAHSRDMLTSLPGASGHLRFVLAAMMENIVSAEGKQLETFIGLASQICGIPECFLHELESQANEVGRLVTKLVGTLNSNWKPSPEYPRMRRVIVEMLMSFVTSYPGYRTMLREEGTMEALSKAAMTPSKVEKYRVFSGGDGVVVECGLPLRDLVDSAKALIGYAVPNSGAQPATYA